jgi:SAM-dependent methyltransferase
MKPEKGGLLDIGAGTGAFLEAAKKNGWDVCGVEPSKMAARSARNKGLDILERIDDLDTDAFFDAITLWHVLEHLPDLEEAVRKIKRLLKPGGVLVVAVPNHLSFDAKYYGSFWAGYDVPRHLWHFSKKSLPPLFEPELLSASVRPMMFDAFYVSLLSEKYRGKKGIMLRAFVIGLWSNLKAIASGEYSSLIYIFNKPNTAK